MHQTFQNIIDSARKKVVVAGCSHAEIVNNLETIIGLTSMQIYGIIGQNHLLEADKLRLNNTDNVNKTLQIVVFA